MCVRATEARGTVKDDRAMAAQVELGEAIRVEKAAEVGGVLEMGTTELLGVWAKGVAVRAWPHGRT